jgi:hypothetical protein
MRGAKPSHAVASRLPGIPRRTTYWGCRISTTWPEITLAEAPETTRIQAVAGLTGFHSAFLLVLGRGSYHMIRIRGCMSQWPMLMRRAMPLAHKGDTMTAYRLHRPSSASVIGDRLHHRRLSPMVCSGSGGTMPGRSQQKPPYARHLIMHPTVHERSAEDQRRYHARRADGGRACACRDHRRPHRRILPA